MWQVSEAEATFMRDDAEKMNSILRCNEDVTISGVVSVRLCAHTSANTAWDAARLDRFTVE
jgi:hypothetical protein